MTRRYYTIVVAIGIGVGAAMTTMNGARGQVSPTALPNTLRPATGFANILDPRSRSLALFEEAGKVLQHPRCVNCHPSTERPRQTDSRRLHLPLVVRGADGHGAPGMRCTTCHHSDNFDSAGIPGNEHWGLAPQSMAWEGRSLGQICE